MAENLQLDACEVLVNPLTFPKEGDIAFIAPDVRPLVVVRREGGVPALSWVRG